MNEAAWKTANNAIEIEAEAIRPSWQSINQDQFANAVGLIIGAQRIAACGCGHSGIVCAHFAHLMCCINRPAKFIPPSEATHGGIGFMQKGDLMVLVSRGGKTSELLPVIEICKQKEIRILTVTENAESFLAAQADVVLAFSVTRETDPHNTQGTTSFLVQASLFHALQAAIIVETGFHEKDFALNHPAGAVGERINRQEQQR